MISYLIKCIWTAYSWYVVGEHDHEIQAKEVERMNNGFVRQHKPLFLTLAIVATAGVIILAPIVFVIAVCVAVLFSKQ